MSRTLDGLSPLMPPDKYTAVWVSHTSMSDFLTCPRAYFLKHVYRDPKTHHKVKLMTPSLALGAAVHETLESLSTIPTSSRFSIPLMVRFDTAWEKVSGKLGGFFDADTEYAYKTRGIAMIRRVHEHPGPIAELSVKIKKDLPYFGLDEEENIILCGKIDWLQYVPETDSVHIIDFKTGKKEEETVSLQLPIYRLLVEHCQKRPVSKASYWYLETSNTLTEKPLPDVTEAEKNILSIGRKIKLSRQLGLMKCPGGTDGCRQCLPFEQILTGHGEFVGEDEYKYDIYIIPRKTAAVSLEDESEIL